MKLVHRPGKENIAADYLSRSPEVINVCNTILEKDNEAQELETLREMHKELLHPGGSRMYKTLKNSVNIKGLKKKCEILAKKCIKCQQEKNFRREFNSSGSIHSTRRNKDLAADILGSIEMSYFSEGGGKRFVLVIMDRHSRFCKLKELKSIASPEMIVALKEWINENGCPETILTDQGRQFVGYEFQEYLQQLNIKPVTNTAYNPTGNSLVERLNQEIAKGLGMQKGDSFRKALKHTEHAISALYNHSIEQIPQEVFRQEILGLKEITEEVNNAVKRKTNLCENKPRKTIQIGKKAWLKNMNINKMSQRWEGPYEIIRTGRYGNTVILNMGDRENRVNVKQIRLA